jgi:hypothetical protein
MTFMLSNITRSEGDPKVIQSGRSSLGSTDRLARALGWFSIGLGVTELLAPRRVASTLGMEGREGLVCAHGVREIFSGILCLSVDKQAGLWTRVAGDGLDLATLLAALRYNNPKRDNVASALAMVLGISLLDFIAAKGTTARHSAQRGERRLYRDRSGFPKGIQATRGAAKRIHAPSDGRAAAAHA